MIGSNYSSSFSFFLRTIVLLLFSISNVFSTFASLKTDLCHPDQRDVLLQLKTEFKIQKPDELDNQYSMKVTSYPKTESWGNRSTDCCNWDGVTCNTESGKVIGLDLSCSCLRIPVEDGVDVLHDVGRDIEEIALVLDRDEGALGTVVHGDTERLVQRADGLDVALHAHVAEHEQAGCYGGAARG